MHVLCRTKKANIMHIHKSYILKKACNYVRIIRCVRI